MARIGLYEKALPQNLTWAERLTWAKKLGFDFLEMSIDESDERLARLAWTPSQLQELSQLMVKEDFFYPFFVFKWSSAVPFRLFK